MPNQFRLNLKHINIYLFFALVGLLFIYPLIYRLVVVAFIFDVLVLAVVIASVLAVSRRLTQVTLISVLGLFVVIAPWSGQLQENYWLDVTSTICGIVFYIVIAIFLAKDVYSDTKKVTWNSIFGAINIYLIFGLVFSYIYYFIFLIEPAAIKSTYPLPDDIEIAFAVLNYFSFVTLTTLGYGDITPQLVEVGVITNLESVIGQIYLVVMVARLVSLHILQSRESK